MGLGLFLTRSVVESLGGHLELQSRPGKGTTADKIAALDAAGIAVAATPAEIGTTMQRALESESMV